MKTPMKVMYLEVFPGKTSKCRNGTGKGRGGEGREEKGREEGREEGRGGKGRWSSPSSPWCRVKELDYLHSTSLRQRLGHGSRVPRYPGCRGVS